MQKQTLDNLILNGEDYIYQGNTLINGTIEIINANLIISGNLTIYGNVNIKNGSIIVSGLLTVAHDATISITGGDISCDSLDCNHINITDGDIWINSRLKALNIKSDGNIEVGLYSNVSYINCLNYLINGDNDSCTIKAIQDIYILGDNDSYDLTAREILVGGDCHTNNKSITAKHFVCGGELFCRGLFIE